MTDTATETRSVVVFSMIVVLLLLTPGVPL